MMLATLAFASLRRHGTRTVLAVLGVAVATALLLDMVMLSSGLRESFRELLEVRGFQIRLAPKGTLPFDTEATIAGVGGILGSLSSHPDVAQVSPVLGASVHIPLGERAVTTFALGVLPAVQGDYVLIGGLDASPTTTAGLPGVVVNDELLTATARGVGDTIRIAAGYNPQFRTYAGERKVVIMGRARFLYLSADQSGLALHLRTLQEITGRDSASARGSGGDRASLVMVRTRSGADVNRVLEWIGNKVPSVEAISTADALAQVDERLSYFRQIARVLGGMSLIVAFLLVTTLVTVSVNERTGEIAVMRAIGVSRVHVVQQVLMEGTVISMAGGAAGLALGMITARYLNGILSAFPGLPSAIDFFYFQPRAVWTALVLLFAIGIAAGAYPSWRAASLPVAQTIRDEAVA
ncbi:MAG: ABC transporter permease [Gemmatimonadaceae bacterium]